MGARHERAGKAPPALPQRGQDPGTPHHEPLLGLPHHGQGHVRPVFQERRQGRAVALQVDQSVGEDEVLLPDVLVVALDVPLEVRAIPREVVPGAGHGHGSG